MRVYPRSIPIGNLKYAINNVFMMSLLSRKRAVSMLCVALFIISAFYIISPADNNYHVHGVVTPKMTIAV